MGLFLFILLFLLGLLLGSLFTLISDRLLDEAPPAFHRYVIRCLRQTERTNGRQGTHREPLPLRYPLGIVGFAAIFAITCLQLGWQSELPAGLLLLGILYVILQTDLAEMTIPNEAVICGLVAAVVLRLIHHPLPFWNYAAAAIGASGFLLAIGLLFEKVLGKEAMGGGDIKLYLFLGLVLGIKLTALSVFLASFLGLLVLLPLQVLNKKGTGEPVPFGPFIAGGAWIALLWGDFLVDAYLNLLM